MLQYMGKVE